MPEIQHTQHEITVKAPVSVVYDIIANATAWPQHFTPTIHVERTELDTSTERLAIWACANDVVKSWTSKRVLDPVNRRISFRQETTSPPTGSMSGEWTILDEAQDTSRVILTHAFSAVGDDPDGLEWIARATDTNSKTELGNIAALAESWEHLGDLVFTFEDSVTVNGPAKAAYDFLYQGSLWPDRLPHVVRLALVEDVPNVQRMSMDTLSADGSVHTTDSVRICFPPEQIVYKQLVTPSLMEAHTGEWVLRKTGGQLLVTSRHTVTLRETAIKTVLGHDATVPQAREFVRKAAGGNSAATLAHAKKYVEAGNV